MEAKRLNKALVLDKNIRLEYGEKTRDEYNNILAYVYIDEIFVNAELIKEGFFAVSPDYGTSEYFEHFKSLESKAKMQKRGIWANLKEQKEKYTGPVIGNRRSLKYHKPNCRFVSKLKDSNKESFENQDEALAAGYAPCYYCRPDKITIKFVPVVKEDL